MTGKRKSQAGLRRTAARAGGVIAVPAGVHLLPVRHHSPRAAAVVRAELDRLAPARVMVEGPADAGDLVPVVVDPATRPPVAILGYRTDGITQSVLWPFAEYSPELVALRWAARHGARAELIDIPVGCALAMEYGRHGEPADAQDPIPARTPGHDDDETVETIDADDPPRVDVSQQIADRLGMRTFDEAWDALIEAPRHDAADFRALLLAYADLLRIHRDRGRDEVRDAFMARRIAAAAAEVGADRVAVVVGAAHAAAFLAGPVVDRDDLPAPVPCAATVIPYSFPRLSEQLGYGAGNRAPRYFQRAHDAGGDLARASLETLVDLCEHLRVRGFAVSLADTIEAWRLAIMLAQIRGKTAPALDETREAAIATLGRGDAALIDSVLGAAAVGHAVGRVATTVGRSSLADEFWREVAARRLPTRDSPEELSLTLNDDVQIATSVFLHRLRVCDIPYASFLGAGRGRNDDAGGLAALGRVHEVWTAQWTPATDIALVEKVVLGSSLEEVTSRVLDQRLAAARTTSLAADVLLEAVVTRCPAVTARALTACDDAASHDDDLPSLARAAAALSTLASYGQSRGGDAAAVAAIDQLLGKVFDRGVLRLPAAAMVTGDAVPPLLAALRVLHEVAMAQRKVDRDAWLAAAHATAGDFTVHPSAAGMATGLLYLARSVSDDEVAAAVGLRLSAGNEPADAAGFLSGFFEVNALVLVKSRPVVAALDAFLCGIPPERFTDVLPVLRRALADLGATERRYLLENVIASRGIGDGARAAARIIEEKDKDKLRALDAELAGALGDLDDLL